MRRADQAARGEAGRVGVAGLAGGGSPVVLQAQGVEKTYPNGTHALDRADVTVRIGEHDDLLDRDGTAVAHRVDRHRAGAFGARVVLVPDARAREVPVYPLNDGTS